MILIDPIDIKAFPISISFQEIKDACEKESSQQITGSDRNELSVSFTRNLGGKFVEFQQLILPVDFSEDIFRERVKELNSQSPRKGQICSFNAN